MGKEVMTYDPKKVSAVAAGRIITGYASDGMIDVSNNADAISPQTGAQGDVAISENADETGTAKLKLLSNSASLEYLRQLATSRKFFTFTLSDANNTDSIFINAENCRIIKKPPVPRGKEVTTVEVDIFIPFLECR